jgi:hypothetical protein
MVVACVILLTAAPANAQLAAGARIGAARGTIGVAIAEFNGRAGIVGPVQAVAGVHWMAHPGGCAQIWPGSYRCGYGGTGVFAGPSIAVLDTDVLHASVAGTLGRFSRTGGFFEAKNNLSWSVGGDAEVRMSRSLRLQVGLHHRRIDDSLYRDLFDDGVRFTSLTAGLMVILRQGSSGG